MIVIFDINFNVQEGSFLKFFLVICKQKIFKTNGLKQCKFRQTQVDQWALLSCVNILQSYSYPENKCSYHNGKLVLSLTTLILLLKLIYNYNNRWVGLLGIYNLLMSKSKISPQKSFHIVTKFQTSSQTVFKQEINYPLFLLYHHFSSTGSAHMI